MNEESTTEAPRPTETEPSESESIESQPTESAPTKPTTPKTAIYDPYQVVNLVIAKCQAGGMITMEDNLENLLAEGRITQVEYDEYYPLDGLEGSYYSIFVEMDLNIASDIVGNKLGSVDGIADFLKKQLIFQGYLHILQVRRSPHIRRVTTVKCETKTFGESLPLSVR